MFVLLWILAFQLSGDDAHLDPRLCERNAHLEPGRYLKIIVIPVLKVLFLKPNWSPQLDFAPGKLKIPRHDPDDRIGRVIQGHASSEYSRVPAEYGLPQA